MIGKPSMNTGAPRHCLTKIDMERCTAVCSVCGPTQIIVTKPDKAGRVRWYCFQKRRAIEKAYRDSHARDQRVQDPNRKPRHKLTNIDAENMMAVCLICGSTDIRMRIQRGHTVYICNTKKRAYARQYKLDNPPRYIPKPRKPRRPEQQPRKPYKPRQSGHALSAIDNENKTAVCLQCGPVRLAVSYSNGRTYRRCINAHNEHKVKLYRKNRDFITAYKVERGCRNCGYNANPDRLEIHRLNGWKRELKIWRLAMFGRERLMQELEKSGVYCIDCRPLQPEHSF